MQTFAKSSFRTKLILLITLASAVAVVLVCAVVVSVTYFSFKRSAIQTLLTQGQMIGIHSIGALEFGDEERAEQTLAALAAVPQVAKAELSTPEGETFATYQRAVDGPPDLEPATSGYYFRGRWLIYTQPVTHDREVLGTLLIVYDFSGIYRQLGINTALALLAGVMAMLAAFLLALRLQRVVARPVWELVSAADAVSRSQDFSIRAAKYSPDELGRLTDAFNNMLGQIQARDAGLKEAQRALAESNRELRLRNEEMQQFVFTVSHDLKSPLVTMRGFAGMLRDDLAAGDVAESQSVVNRILGATEKMNRLIDDLLELSRIGRMRTEPERVDTTALVRGVLEDQAVAVEQAGATVEVQPDMPPLVIERTRLWQVFENLLTNALKYGCEGPVKRIEVGGTSENGELRYFVRDHGPGIAREHHQKIFGLFQRLHTDNRGTGVGLAIVARVMQVYGGRCWVESEPGNGATFWFALPASLATDAGLPTEPPRR
jgi:signal transduction histidine kinase